jgi:uncharacterized protein
MEPNTAPIDDPDLIDPSDAQPADSRFRTCIVTRAELPPDDLIRFVVGPDGQVVPDLARRLPGRGVWVSLDSKAVTAAVKSKAFSRSMKRQVKADPELPALIERLLVRRAVEALSIANKAGLVVSGFAKVDAELTRGPLALLHAADAAEDGSHKLDRKWLAINADAKTAGNGDLEAETAAGQGAEPMARQGRPAPIFSGLTIDQLSLAIGRENVVHACLRQGGAASRVVDALIRIMRYRGGASVLAAASGSSVTGGLPAAGTVASEHLIDTRPNPADCQPGNGPKAAKTDAPQ